MNIHLVIALSAEAKPIRQALGLVRTNKLTEFPVYQAGNISCIITGIGEVLVRHACRYLHQQSHQHPTIWINIGVAGHRNHQLGTLLYVVEASSPHLSNNMNTSSMPNTNIPSTTLISSGQPNTQYQGNFTYDMEGAFFIDEVQKLPTTRQIYCLKVISDNLDHPISELNGKKIHQLMNNNQIITFIQPLNTSI